MKRLTVLLAVAGLALAGCQSTQDKNDVLEAKGGDLVKLNKLDIGAENRKVDVVDKVVLTDQYGTAVAVVMKNKSQEGLSDAPIQVDVKDAKGRSVYKNDLAGNEKSLVTVPVVEPGAEVFWVNDQVMPIGGKPASVDVTVGEAKPLPAAIPEIVVSPPKLSQDPVSGLKVAGTVTNKSDVEQSNLVLYAIARKNGKIVAAGRGMVARLKAGGAPSTYNIFFIGDPSGAKISVIAPPVTLSGGS